MELHHPFFREKALKEYMQRQEKDFLPRFLSPYITILSYLLLFLLLLIGLYAWWGKVPLSISGSGVVLINRPAHALRNDEMVIALFIPAKYVSQLHPGEDVELHIEPAGRQFSSAIKYVETTIISPDEARKQYMLNGGATQVIPQSSVVAILRPVATSAPHLEPGDFVSAQVHIGSQSILSFCLFQYPQADRHTASAWPLTP
jgi:hypothetical protein